MGGGSVISLAKITLINLPFLFRLQFFKYFILPIFDYCLSLICYYFKTQIQRLANCYNACLSLFAHKLINVPAAPIIRLKEQFLFNSKRNLPYNLRNVKTLCVPHTNNHNGELTFQYFFNMFVEKICISHMNSPFTDFRSK